MTTVNLGSVNFPKLMRHLGHRTNQVRDLVFARDPIYRKSTKATGATTDTLGNTGSDKALAGPAVNFGYEQSNFQAQSKSGDNAYHTNSPELILPGLKAIQSPITSRSGKLERTGHRISGACKFYMPSLEYIRNTKEFKDVPAFDELETYDKLIDVERIILPRGSSFEDVQVDPNPHSTTSRGHNFNMPGYELDRFQFQLRSTTTATVDAFELRGIIGGVLQYLVWECDTAIDTSEYDIFDFPVRDVENGDTTSVYIDGTQHTLTASLSTASKSGTVNTSGVFDVDKMTGADTNNLFQSAKVFMTSEESIDMKAFGYKAAEWRVESIKDFRDEYMEVAAVRVRGDRTSRRRAYG